jgi:hypothetical protein
MCRRATDKSTWKEIAALYRLALGPAGGEYPLFQRAV